MQTRRGFLVECALAGGAALLGLDPPAGFADGAPDKLREAVDRARTKVIILKTRRGEGRGAATGFLARPGLVITAGHAVDAETQVTAWLNGVSYSASLLLRDPDNDLAVLDLRAPDLLLKPVELARTAEALAEGEELVILAGPSQGARAQGEPADRVPLPAAFRRRALVPLPNGRRAVMLKLDAAVRRGDSGSPVIRVRDGQVVGVLSSRELPDAAGVSRAAYAVPAEAMHPWLESAARRNDPEEEFYLRRVLNSGK